MQQERSSNNATALGILKLLDSELRERKSDVNLSINPEQTVALFPNLPRLWEDLLRCLLAPITRSLLSGLLKTADGGKTFSIPTLDKKMRLGQWVENITDFFSVSSEGAGINFNLPPNFEAIEIWRDGEDSDWNEWHKLKLTPHPSKIPEKQLRKIRSPYWNSLYVVFRSWLELIGATLEHVSWNANQEVIEIIMRIKGAFDTIEDFYVKEADYPFRVVSFRPPQPHFVAETSDALLLTGQLIAKQGGNWLNLVELLDNQLTVKLTVSRADTELSYPPTSLTSQLVIETLLGHILAQIPPKYIEASQRLEGLLLKIGQLASFASDSDDETLQNVLGELRLIREGITILGNNGSESFNEWFLNDYIKAKRPHPLH